MKKFVFKFFLEKEITSVTKLVFVYLVSFCILSSNILYYFFKFLKVFSFLLSVLSYLFMVEKYQFFVSPLKTTGTYFLTLGRHSGAASQPCCYSPSSFQVLILYLTNFMAGSLIRSMNFSAV